MPQIDLGSVVGPQGPEGKQGKEGPTGPQGEPASVNGKTPDEKGKITLGAADIKCSDGTDVNAAINARVNKDGSSTTAFSFGYDAGGLYVVTP